MDPSFAQTLQWLVTLAVVLFVFLALLQLFGIKRLLQQLVDLHAAQSAPRTATADRLSVPRAAVVDLDTPKCFDIDLDAPQYPTLTFGGR